MKVFKVTGWIQYKTAPARPINNIQLAEDAETALRDVKSQLSTDERIVLYAKELVNTD